jgi:DNA-binding IclR family transcriptional regulator
MKVGAATRDEHEGSAEKEELQTLGRAIRILEFLVAAPGGAGLSELAHSCAMSKAGVLRILRTWQANGYVKQGPDARYRIGWKLFVMARGRSEAQDLRETARPYIESLRDVSNETLLLALLAQEEVVYIDKIEGRQRVRVTTEIGRRVPLYATGSGKAILAYQEEAFVERIIRNAQPFTEHTVVTAAQMSDEIMGTRRRGYSIAKGELTDSVGSVAAPLFSSGGGVEAAVSIVFPVAGVSDERIAALGALVSETARHISEELGWIALEKEKQWLTNR